MRNPPYPDRASLLDYCRRSANPVGRLVLHLFGRTEPEHLAQSDCICSALQLINFWQDVAVDLDKDRIYLPEEDMARFGVTEENWREGVKTDPHFSERASPLSFAGPKRAQPPGLALEQLPRIDLVLISHNHYDHLDLDSVQALNRQPGGPPLFVVPLGIERWCSGVPSHLPDGAALQHRPV